MATSPARNLASTFVVLEPDHAAIPVDVTPTVFEELDRRFDGFAGRLLVSSFSFDKDWDSWEQHPAGDEIVCLLSGEATLVLDRAGVTESIRLTTPGAFVIVPKGVWHTARTTVATSMAFVTPGMGTRNKPVD